MRGRVMAEKYGHRSETNRLVMEACADDYEEFSMIVSEIEEWTNGASDSPDVNGIVNALIQSIADKDIEAYEVREHRLQLTTVQPDRASIADLWFYVTDKGK